MNNPILALIPSGYKEDKVYSVLPNDSTGDFIFARASKGTSCLLYTSPSPRDRTRSRMPSSA